MRQKKAASSDGFCDFDSECISLAKSEDVDSASRFDIALDFHGRFCESLKKRPPPPAFTFVLVFMALSFHVFLSFELSL